MMMLRLRAIYTIQSVGGAMMISPLMSLQKPAKRWELNQLNYWEKKTGL